MKYYYTLNIPENIEVKINNMEILVKGPKGELTTTIVDDRIKFEISENILIFSRSSDEKEVTNVVDELNDNNKDSESDKNNVENDEETDKNKGFNLDEDMTEDENKDSVENRDKI